MILSENNQRENTMTVHRKIQITTCYLMTTRSLIPNSALNSIDWTRDLDKSYLHVVQTRILIILHGHIFRARDLMLRIRKNNSKDIMLSIVDVDPDGYGRSIGFS